MAWRVVEHDDRRWTVSIAAERRANSPHWNLVFSFRPTEVGQRSIWATYPVASSSKAALFAQAEALSDAALTALLAEQLQ
jgi:hypothetical protein